MTTTMPGIPDPSTVLRRVDNRLATRAGDDPLPPETIDEFAEAVRRQIMEPLAAGAAAPVDDGELEELRGQLADAEQRATTATTDLADLRRQLDELADVQARAEVYRQERDAEAAENQRLATLLEEARRAASEVADELERVRGEVPAEAEHRHAYPWDDPKGVPGSCACGHAYPRTLPPVDTDDEPEAAAPEPWAGLLGRVRAELKGWPA
ncbi:hypothetical protein [Amycolatopsis suaedae]|uniref:Uncharacterized protein n=1 Tax=Amycolatopsis suaedae TaxID=2510978 RepID=A0A4Q7J0B9_9PSEU|nr:hypothetical protein [Amycolatopsis suaedae]RZQ59816.1 hypothetical protein EWH70_32390 [Amycolatopsis suaedae]